MEDGPFSSSMNPLIGYLVCVYGALVALSSIIIGVLWLLGRRSRIVVTLVKLAAITRLRDPKSEKVLWRVSIELIVLGAAMIIVVSWFVVAELLPRLAI